MAHKQAVSSRAPIIRKLALGIAAGALMVGGIAGSAVAVPPHRHCMLTPQGYVEVAPGIARRPRGRKPSFLLPRFGGSSSSPLPEEGGLSRSCQDPCHQRKLSLRAWGGGPHLVGTR